MYSCTDDMLISILASRRPRRPAEHSRSELWDARRMPDSENGRSGSAGGRRGRLLTKIEISMSSVLTVDSSLYYLGSQFGRHTTTFHRLWEI